MGSKVRKATVEDVPHIHKLINHFAKKGMMLARSLNEIYEHLQEFFVLEKNNQIIGCCALHVAWNDLAEIKCLSVKENEQRKGYGKRLLMRCHQEAKTLKVKRIFVLTFLPDFFIKFGYSPIRKSKLPHKIWNECINCPFFPDCKEKALIYNLEGR